MASTAEFVEPAVVSLELIAKGAKACATASEARRAADAADTAKSIAMMAVFEPLLGIKTEDELKALSIEEIQRIVRRRVKAGLVKLAGIKVETLLTRVIQQSQCRRNVGWKDAFVAALGESRATAVIQETPESHSYKLVAP